MKPLVASLWLADEITKALFYFGEFGEYAYNNK